MAYFEKRVSAKGAVSWRVQIRRRGATQTRTFRSKARAREWAIQVEAGITGEAHPLGKHTLLEAMRRYAREVSPDKRGARWERIRLKSFEVAEMAKLPIAAVTSDHLGAWRDSRLQKVGPATVRRDMTLLAGVFELARTEWKWIRTNPMRDVRKPREPAARRRGVSADDFKAVADRLSRGPAGREVLAGFELAIETGMRAGEMWSLEREQIDLGARVAHLERTKNGDARGVALSPRAVEIIEGLLADGRPGLFTISNASRDALFRKARDAAGIPDLHFHDSRSEAVSRLSKRLKVQDLADQIGHRDLNSLMLYYKPSPADRARQLADEPRTRRSPRKPPTEGEPPRRSRG